MGAQCCRKRHTNDPSEEDDPTNHNVNPGCPITDNDGWPLNRATRHRVVITYPDDEFFPTPDSRRGAKCRCPTRR